MATSPVPKGGPPDPAIQRALAEPLLDKKLQEGEFWYTIVSEWLQQWRRHVGVLPVRKYYHSTASPGPLITLREYGHSTELVHEDVWKLFFNWYGLSDGHRSIKHAVYSYRGKADIENNFNTLTVVLAATEQSERGHVVRCSKLEKVGYVEYKARQMFRIAEERITRLWGKSLESDVHWQPLFTRDKSIGKMLELDSDFLRSVVALEVQSEDKKWTSIPSPHILDESSLQDETMGKLYEQSVFEDLTSSWEMNIHSQIDKLGKGFMQQLHLNFSNFVSHARDYIDDRELSLRSREQDLDRREDHVRTQETLLDEREMELNSKIELHASGVTEFQQEYKEKVEKMEEGKRDLKEEAKSLRQKFKESAEALEAEKTEFQEELQRMSEIYQIQDTRIKLDIGGHLYTTSKLTLTKEPRSMLAAMFSGRHSLKAEPDGSYFIDRDGTHFRYILNYLRDGGLKEGSIPHNPTLWRELCSEAQYFQLDGLVEHLQGLIMQEAGMDPLGQQFASI